MQREHYSTKNSRQLLPITCNSLHLLKCNFTISVYIAEAHAHIHDSNGGDIMVKKGSNIELNCTVESGDRVHHSLAVFWYLDDTVIDWMGQTGSGNGVQVLFTIREDIYIS